MLNKNNIESEIDEIEREQIAINTRILAVRKYYTEQKEKRVK